MDTWLSVDGPGKTYDHVFNTKEFLQNILGPSSRWLWKSLIFIFNNNKNTYYIENKESSE